MEFNKENFDFLVLENKIFKERIIILNDKLTIFESEINELKRIINQNSSNSSKPPSSDSFKRNPQPAFPKNKDKQNPKGGQVGHEGSTLAFVENPDNYNLLAPQVCPCCGGVLREAKIKKTGFKRQVIDIPLVVKPVVTEYEIGYAACCGKKHFGIFPPEAKAPTQYGNNVKAFVVLLSVQNNLSVEKIACLLKDVYSINMSTGTICNILEKMCHNLEPQINKIKEILCEAKLVHLDETSLNVQGKNYWLHVASTTKITFQYLNKGRGAEAHNCKAGFKPSPDQIIVHDCWRSYFTHYKNNPHVICNAHIIRELKGIIENYQTKWASVMLEYLYALYNVTKNGGILVSKQKTYWIKKYNLITQQANIDEPLALKNGKQGKPKQTKGRNLLSRLIDEQESILRFAFEENIPFTNNQAERDIRGAKTKQKNATHFGSTDGAENYLTIKSFISTLAKNGTNILQGITQILKSPDNIFNFSSA